MDKCTPQSLLAGKNIKLTRQRNSVLLAIIDSGGPFCAADLHAGLSGEMDLATIYRNLEMLERVGIIRNVVNEKERQYYEIACMHNPEHPHFLCNRCGRIFCLKKEKAVQAEESLPGDFSVEQTTVQYRGLCPKCKDV